MRRMGDVTFSGLVEGSNADTTRVRFIIQEVKRARESEDRFARLLQLVTWRCVVFHGGEFRENGGECVAVRNALKALEEYYG